MKKIKKIKKIRKSKKKPLFHDFDLTIKLYFPIGKPIPHIVRRLFTLHKH